MAGTKIRRTKLASMTTATKRAKPNSRIIKRLLNISDPKAAAMMAAADVITIPVLSTP